MELDDIKTAWQSLDSQLKKQESIKESILKELIRSKGNNSLNKLTNYEWFSLIIIVLAAPIIPYILYTSPETFNLLSLVILILLEAFILLNIGAQVWKIRKLDNIDFSQQISNNLKEINTYNLFIKREKGLAFILFILLIIFYINRTCFDSINLSNLNIFIYFFITTIGIMLCIWQYKKLYSKNIESIKRSLDELRELEEELE